MPRRSRRRAWGSVTRVTREKHVIRWVESTPEGRKRRSKTIHGTYREACAELDRIHARVGDPRPCPTVGQAARAWWLPWMGTSRLSPRSRELYRDSWERVCAPRWDTVPLDAVRPIDLQEWLASLPAGSAATAVVVLRKVGDLAVMHEAVDVNRFRAPVEVPAAGGGRSKAVLSLAEADEWLARLRGQRIEAPFLLACFGGLRTGESLAVRADAVSRAESHGVALALARVEMQVADDGEPTDRLKTPQSRRVAVVPGPYAERLLEIADERRADGGEWLADRRDGLPMSKSALGHEWRRAGGGVPWSNLRASWRTFAQFDWGVEPDALELLMGHALPGVTGRHYLRPSVEMLCDAVGEAYAAFGDG